MFQIKFTLNSVFWVIRQHTQSFHGGLLCYLVHKHHHRQVWWNYWDSFLFLQWDKLPSLFRQCSNRRTYNSLGNLNEFKSMNFIAIKIQRQMKVIWLVSIWCEEVAFSYPVGWLSVRTHTNKVGFHFKYLFSKVSVKLLIKKINYQKYMKMNFYYFSSFSYSFCNYLRGFCVRSTEQPLPAGFECYINWSPYLFAGWWIDVLVRSYILITFRS